MEKLFSYLNSIPGDKVRHALAGAIIASIYHIILALTHAPLDMASVGAIGAVGSIGAAKEIYDYYHPATRTCDIMDWVATMIGGLIVILSWVVK